MKLQDALNVLGLTGSNITLEQAKAAYRRASQKFHPDRNPGGLQMMQAVNAAWQVLQGLDWDRPVNAEPSANADYGDALNAAINAVVDLAGLRLEVCGAWVWVSGDTKTHKAALKAAGFFWASKKFMWYFRPPEWRSSNRGQWDMDKIREVHGSESVTRGRRQPEADRERLQP